MSKTERIERLQDKINERDFKKLKKDFGFEDTEKWEYHETEA